MEILITKCDRKIFESVYKIKIKLKRFSFFFNGQFQNVRVCIDYVKFNWVEVLEKQKKGIVLM